MDSDSLKELEKAVASQKENIRPSTDSENYQETDNTEQIRLEQELVVSDENDGSEKEGAKEEDADDEAASADQDEAGQDEEYSAEEDVEASVDPDQHTEYNKNREEESEKATIFNSQLSYTIKPTTHHNMYHGKPGPKTMPEMFLQAVKLHFHNPCIGSRKITGRTAVSYHREITRTEIGETIEVNNKVKAEIQLSDWEYLTYGEVWTRVQCMGRALEELRRVRGHRRLHMFAQTRFERSHPF
jgi:hypothetical protein